MKRLSFSILIILIIFLGTHHTSAQVKDLDKCSIESRKAVEALMKKGVIGGGSSGNFNPKAKVTRAEFVKMLMLAIDPKSLDTDGTAASVFADVPENYWAKKHIMSASRHQYVLGTSTTTFSPAKNITREQLATMFFRILIPATEWRYYGSTRNVDKLKDKNQVAAYAKNTIEIMMVTKLMESTKKGTFEPKRFVTKEEAATIIYKYMSNKDKIINDLFNYELNWKPDPGKFIMLGSSEGDVYSVMGKTREHKYESVTNEFVVYYSSEGTTVSVFDIPTQNFLKITYENSHVYLTTSGKVIGWKNTGNLKVKVNDMAAGKKFTFGSSKEELFKAMGTPKSIFAIGAKIYLYYDSCFILIENNKVISWSENKKGVLKLVSSTIDSGSTFTYNSNFDEVIRVMGLPRTLYIDTRGVVLEYGKSRIFLDRGSLKVKHWQNSGELKTWNLSKESNAPAVTIGSLKGDLIKSMGMPDKIENSNSGDPITQGQGLGEYWSYGSSKVHFNDTWVVDGWENKGDLKLKQVDSPTKAPIIPGSTRGEVFNAYGTPDYCYPSIIKYNNTVLEMDWKSSSVSKILNKDKNIKTAVYDRISHESIALNDPWDKVIGSIGEPDQVRKDSIYLQAYYGNSYLIFNKDNKLMWFKNTDGNIDIDIGKAQPGRTFTLLSSYEDVIAAMGTPEMLEGDEGYGIRLYYGDSVIKLGKDNKVYYWANGSNNLKLRSNSENEYSISFGTSLEEVLRIMGTPNQIDSYGGTMESGDREIYALNLTYGKSSIMVRKENSVFCVVGWNNLGELKMKNNTVQMGKPLISLGDKLEKIIKLKGLPNRAYTSQDNGWGIEYFFVYDKTVIRFNDRKLVSSIVNGNNDISLFEGSPIAASGGGLNMKSTRNDVLRALGEPNSISDYYIYNNRVSYNGEWKYSDGLRITFEEDGVLREFQNNYGRINMGTRQENAPEVRIGSSIEDAIKRFGTPVSINNYLNSSNILEFIYEFPEDRKISHDNVSYTRVVVTFDMSKLVSYVGYGN